MSEDTKPKMENLADAVKRLRIKSIVVRGARVDIDEPVSVEYLKSMADLMDEVYEEYVKEFGYPVHKKKGSKIMSEENVITHDIAHGTLTRDNKKEQDNE